MIQFEPKPTFNRLLAKLPSDRKEKAKEATLRLVHCLTEQTPPPKGLGLQCLHKPYWEIRTTKGDRILFAWESNLVEWLLVGSHDDIQRFLKHH